MNNNNETLNDFTHINYKIDIPDIILNVNEVFNIDCDVKVSAFSTPSEYVPNIDYHYKFHHDTTLAIIAGFNYNKRVMIQGYHGTGKSTHIEQVAARLNWPCIRINLDSYISRTDLIGKDVIILHNNKQITKFQEGILPWAIRQPVAIIFDEYDAGRPDVMFVLQHILEMNGKFTLLNQNKVLYPHTSFRIFATSNTIGLGDSTGLYHGSQLINQAQIDRWSIVAKLNYLSIKDETEIVLLKLHESYTKDEYNKIESMVKLAHLTRKGFIFGDVSTLMSLRTIISFAENSKIFNNVAYAFCISFLNRCDETEVSIFSEYYQRCFGEELNKIYTNSI